MKEHAEKFLETAKRLRFSVFEMAPADYLLEVIELKRKKGQRMLTEDDTAKMKAALEQSPKVSVTAEVFMGEEILRSWLETEAGDEEARRHCLVNGLIPYSEENLKGLNFYIDARHIPKEIKDRFLKIAATRNGDHQEEVEIREIKVLKTEIDGAWISDGKPIDFKVRVKRHVAVATFYNYGVDE